MAAFKLKSVLSDERFYGEFTTPTSVHALAIALENSKSMESALTVAHGFRAEPSPSPSRECPPT